MRIVAGRWYEVVMYNCCEVCQIDAMRCACVELNGVVVQMPNIWYREGNVVASCCSR